MAHRPLLTLLALLALAACEKVPTDAVAVVDDHPIRRATFDAYIARHGKPDLSAEERAQLLDQAINVQLLAQEALHQKLDLDPKVNGDIELQRNMRLANALLTQHIEANPITDGSLRKAYAERFASVHEVEYKARHVLVPSLAEAREIVKQLQRGASFQRIAKARSIDPGTATNGGELPWFSASGMIPVFSQAVATMKKGQFTAQPVQSQFGYHVILLEDTRQSQPPAFEAVREEIMGSLREQQVEAYINGLRGPAKIVKRDAPAAAPATTAAAAPAAEQR